VLQKQVIYHSKGIMDALLEYNALHHQMTVAQIYITTLRNRMKEVEEHDLCRPLYISQLERRRLHLRSTKQLVASIISILKSITNIQLFVAESRYVEALQLVNSTRTDVEKLKQLQGLSKLNKQLNEQNVVIEKSLEQAFMKVVMHLQYEDIGDQQQIQSLLQTRLVPVVDGLIRVRRLDTVLRAYRDEMIRYSEEFIKITWDKSVSRHNENTKTFNHTLRQASPMSPASSSDRITHDQFMEAIGPVFDTVLTILTKTQLMAHAIQQFSKDATVIQSMQNILNSIYATCDSTISSIIGLRSVEINRMSRKHLLQYMSTCFEFVGKCEKLMNIEMKYLRGTLFQHGQLFLIHFTTQKIQVLQNVLDNELWVHIDKVPPEFQDLVNRFTQSELITSETNQRSTMYLEIDGKKFPTVNSFIILLKILSDYFDLDTPTFHFITIVDLTQTLYKLFIQFNNKILQLVLNGGAANPHTGIKVITVQHLLLAYESLHCLIHLVPYIQRMLEARLEDKQQHHMNKFDNFIELCKNHQEEISRRITSMTQERINDQIQIALKFKWDSVQADQESPLNITMKFVVFTFSVVDLYLGEHRSDQVRIMTPLVRHIVDKLKAFIDSVKKNNKKTKERLKSDLTPFRLLLNDPTNREKYATEVDLTDFEKTFDKAFGSVN
jgi:hypothetical protein